MPNGNDVMNTAQKIWHLLRSVPDPEVPVLSVVDLGIIRDITVLNDHIEITITPTYSGCPAMDVITTQIQFELIKNGYKDFHIKKVLSPAWTTDWMSEEGKQKLKAYGIAPPGSNAKRDTIELFADAAPVPCPLCNSSDTSLISEFGSTACKALYRCNHCHEPFDHFKCH